MLQKANGNAIELSNKKYSNALSYDLLNPVTFSLATNDLFIRTQKFSYEGMTYKKDRGYAFEKQLNENTMGLLDKPLSAYKEAERKGKIPMMIFSPSVLNDGRRLQIASQPMSYLCGQTNGFTFSPINHGENIEFLRAFKKQNAEHIRFLTVLRMNATFPYIMPTVDMPTEPQIEIFDSGLRDNYGIKTSVRFIYQLREWLEENTSGIVILQLRDGLKQSQKISKPKTTLVDELMGPFGSLYGNMFYMQDFNNDEILEYAKAWFGGQVDVVDFELNKSNEEPISLSWHLTSKEKEKIFESVELPQNKRAAAFLKKRLNE